MLHPVNKPETAVQGCTFSFLAPHDLISHAVYRYHTCKLHWHCYLHVHTHSYCSVIRRLVTLIYQRAHLEAEVTAIRRQAEQANRELQRRLQEDDDKEVHVHVCTLYMYMYVCTMYKSKRSIGRQAVSHFP